MILHWRASGKYQGRENIFLEKVLGAHGYVLIALAEPAGMLTRQVRLKTPNSVCPGVTLVSGFL